MIEKLKKHIKNGNCYTGVEYVEHDNNILELHCTQISRKKGALEIMNSFTFKTITEFSSKIKKGTPLYLVVNTPHVISKIVKKRMDNDLATINNAFPTINLDAFYYEITSFGSQTMVAICRKEHITEVLDSFLDKKHEIVGFSLAFQQLYRTESFINKSIIKLPYTTLNKETYQIFSKEKNKPSIEEYDINGVTIKNTFLLSFSAALSQFFQGPLLASNFIEKIDYLKNEYYQKRFFKLFSKAFGIFILSLLLVNFLFFNHYFQKIEALEQTTAINASNKEKLLKLSELVLKKEKLVDDVVSSSSSRSSMYLDQIASLLPNTLLLSSMNYQPVESKIKKNEAILFKLNVLEIEGYSKNDNDFSKWTEAIEKLNWVQEVAIENYGFENKTTSFFKIAIQVINE